LQSYCQIQTTEKEHGFFEDAAGPRKKSLACLVLFEEIYALKRQLKLEKTASSKKSTKEG
jgi:hypothetical protein